MQRACYGLGTLPVILWKAHKWPGIEWVVPAQCFHKRITGQGLTAAEDTAGLAAVPQTPPSVLSSPTARPSQGAEGRGALRKHAAQRGGSKGSPEEREMTEGISGAPGCLGLALAELTLRRGSSGVHWSAQANKHSPGSACPLLGGHASPSLSLTPAVSTCWDGTLAHKMNYLRAEQKAAVPAGGWKAAGGREGREASRSSRPPGLRLAGRSHDRLAAPVSAGPQEDRPLVRED